jgi:hypothetical protein
VSPDPACGHPCYIGSNERLVGGDELEGMWKEAVLEENNNNNSVTAAGVRSVCA